jgi:hypothetical protein
VIDTVSYQQSYTNPVVVGQVMSTNDPAHWSVFWASSNSRTSPPSTQLNVGKHAAEDTSSTPPTETIGYLVIEATQDGDLEGLPFVAGVGADTVLGVDNGTYQYDYTAMPNAKTAILSSAGMDGGDGGWPVLRGTNPVPAKDGKIYLSIDEDQRGDSERKHTTEQVAYFVIDPPQAAEIAEPSADHLEHLWCSVVDVDGSWGRVRDPMLESATPMASKGEADTSWSRHEPITGPQLPRPSWRFAGEVDQLFKNMADDDEEEDKKQELIGPVLPPYIEWNL